MVKTVCALFKHFTLRFCNRRDMMNAGDNMTDFKTRFAFIRNKRSYTQVALAKAIGVSRGVISNIEYGMTKPSQITINALCEALNVNEEWLMNGTGDIEPSNDRSKLLNKLYRECSELSEAEQLYVLDFIEIMKKHQRESI